MNRAHTYYSSAYRRRRVIVALLIISVAAVIALAVVSAIGLARAVGAGAPQQGGPASGGVPGAIAGGGSGSDGADGNIAGDPLPLDADHPAITRLDPELLAALRAAEADAAERGISFYVSSGWRSEAMQRQLFEQAVGTYGSAEEAARWVASPEKSAHVRGAAVDIWPTDADDWLNRFGARYGICQIYANEIWHFELATAPGGECPAQLSDARG